MDGNQTISLSLKHFPDMTKDDYAPVLQQEIAYSKRQRKILNSSNIFSFYGHGWNTFLEDVWWSRFRQPTKRRGSGDNAENGLCRTVPAEYYSRHQMLKGESPNYILPPSSQGQKGSAPVYTYRPGTTTTQLLKPWPTRAHDGSMEQGPTNRRESLSSNETDSAKEH